MKVLIVGAGVFGLTVAERMASAGAEVHLIDRRDHIGGNAYSTFDPATGIEIHPYGAHLFHTNNSEVWDYVNRFTRFTSYEHRVWAQHDGALFPLPFNLATLSHLLGTRMSPVDGSAFIAKERSEAGILDPERDLESKAISLIGRSMYEAFVRDYTAKQWQTDPRDLPASIISRLPVRMTFDTRYFSDTYQGQPVDGFTRWFERMVDHPNIMVELGVAFDPEHLDDYLATYEKIVYTGPVDEFFNYSEGALGWRTVDFEWEHLTVGDAQGCPVLNYSDMDTPYTRTIEFRHFNPERDYPTDRTVVAHETSRWANPGDEPYYPVNSPGDREIMGRYRDLARKHPNVIFGGRLGTYTYLDMHMAIASALSVVRNRLS